MNYGDTLVFAGQNEILGEKTIKSNSILFATSTSKGNLLMLTHDGELILGDPFKSSEIAKAFAEDLMRHWLALRKLHDKDMGK